MRRQCELLGLNRSSFYYESAKESADNLELMELLDQQYMKTPFYGKRKMKCCLEAQGHKVNIKRVARLMRLMGIEAIYPKPKTTIRSTGHKIYPYLLKGLTIDRPNLVWCTDITYIPLGGDSHRFVQTVRRICATIRENPPFWGRIQSSTKPN